MERQKWATQQAAQVAREVVPTVPTPVPAPTEVPPTPVEVPPPIAEAAPLAPPARAPIPGVSLVLSALIQDIHHDLGQIFQCFERLGQKVGSMDRRLVHIEGIVNPSRALKPRIIVDILSHDKDESDEDEDA